MTFFKGGVSLYFVDLVRRSRFRSRCYRPGASVLRRRFHPVAALCIAKALHGERTGSRLDARGAVGVAAREHDVAGRVARVDARMRMMKAVQIAYRAVRSRNSM